MKRLHVHVSVDDLAPSIQFYSTLFAVEPTVTKEDYAKWMLDDPRVNFAISQRGEDTGVRHLGIQVEDRAELADVYSRLQRAEAPILEEGATTCCYAKSEKSWRRTGCAARVGTSSLHRMRRRSTSSLPYVTTPPARFVRSGRANRWLHIGVSLTRRQWRATWRKQPPFAGRWSNWKRG